MKVIFLDIDGVLNNAGSWKGAHQVDPKIKSARIDPVAAFRLKSLVSATGAKIVISSTWRNIFQLEHIAGMLWRYGIPQDSVIGKTPRLGRRGHEIKAWLKLNGEKVEKYVILDDDSDAYSAEHPLYKNFIKTDWLTGLLPEHVIEAHKILGKKGESVH